MSMHQIELEDGGFEEPEAAEKSREGRTVSCLSNSGGAIALVGLFGVT